MLFKRDFNFNRLFNKSSSGKLCKFRPLLENKKLIKVQVFIIFEEIIQNFKIHKTTVTFTKILIEKILLITY